MFAEISLQWGNYSGCEAHCPRVDGVILRERTRARNVHMLACGN
jgi:hypothetical protein